MSDKLIQCPRCGDPITNELGDNPICGACALASELNAMALLARIAELETTLQEIHQHYDDTHAEEVTELNARIAELEKSAVVWHKYPDEKPNKDGWYLTSYKGQIRMHFWDNKRVFFDTNPTDIPYVRAVQPANWAYLPEPPEVKQ